MFLIVKYKLFYYFIYFLNLLNNLLPFLSVSCVKKIKIKIRVRKGEQLSSVAAE